MKLKITNFFKKIKEYNKIASIGEIGRRYFAMNSFDGILTILGVLVGNYIAKVSDPKIIISTGFGVSIAMGISGMWGTYMTEQAERKKKLNDLGRATLTNLSHTKLAKAENAATIIVSLIDGLSPFFAAFIVILPFFFSTLIGIKTAFIISLAIAFILLALLGAFLGHISKVNMFVSGMKMVIAGIVCAGLILLLGLPV
jgi:predicted membrane protein (TIGR00267 family)